MHYEMATTVHPNGRMEIQFIRMGSEEDAVARIVLPARALYYLALALYNTLECRPNSIVVSTATQVQEHDDEESESYGDDGFVMMLPPWESLAHDRLQA